MSRHRNVKTIDIEEEQEDYSDYGNSVEDNFCLSPSTAQFIYQRDPNRSGLEFGDHLTIPIAKESTHEDYDLPEDETTVTCSPIVVMQSVTRPTSKLVSGNFYDPRSPKAEPLQRPMSQNLLNANNQRETIELTDSASCAEERLADVVKGMREGEMNSEEGSLQKLSLTDQSYPNEPSEISTSEKLKTETRQTTAQQQDGKPILNLVVVGHVDAGKSTLMGHLLYIMGNVEQKTMHKYKQESQRLGKSSFAYAWVLDESVEERERGITMDIAQTRFETEKFSFILLDAPGHKDFIPNMITGASQADVALLVINATRGEFESGFDLGGQTREHTVLVRSLGVVQLLIAVNKMDTVEWSEERFVEVKNRVGNFLKQVGFGAKCLFVPCSGLTGENLKTVPDDSCPLTRWYSGPTLVQALDSMEPIKRLVERPLRFTVSNVFKAQRGSNFYVAGKVATGSVSNGDKLVVVPSGQTGVVKSILIGEDEERREAKTGEQCNILLTGLDMSAVGSGDVLCPVGSPVTAVSRFQAKIVTFDPNMPLVKGMQVIVHGNGSQQPGYLSKLIAEVSKSTGKVTKSKPRCLARNSSGVVEVTTEKPMCFETSHVSKELSRVTLRFKGSTIAAGVVTELK
uniref:Tr-type G domain-containing protein n=1 Tax=Trichuris muris TaxID=70415 RepID=A0A5S6QYX8_TRIMR